MQYAEHPRLMHAIYEIACGKKWSELRLHMDLIPTPDFSKPSGANTIVPLLNISKHTGYKCPVHLT